MTDGNSIGLITSMDTGKCDEQPCSDKKSKIVNSKFLDEEITRREEEDERKKAFKLMGLRK